jgi:hypothetical protein
LKCEFFAPFAHAVWLGSKLAIGLCAAGKNGRGGDAIMRSALISGVIGIVALSGCGSVRGGVASMQAQSPSELSSVRVGHARLLDARINPSAGVSVAADEDGVVVRFAHPRGLGEVERLDPVSLYTLSQGAEEVDRAPSTQGDEQRVVLDGGRFIVIWKSGDAENGYRAMAQAFNSSDQSPRGAPVAISPWNANVSGPLGAATSDGEHVVATLAASSAGGSFAAYAVPLEAL